MNLRKEKTKNIRKQKGITLIALVVTIVVLLILAGITINMLFSENGIITKAKQAAEETAKAEEKETAGMQNMVNDMDYLINSVNMKINLSQSQAELVIGETLTLTATVTPEDLGASGVNWASSDESVATVENGVVTAVGKGETTITATTVEPSDKKGECKIIVKSSLAKLVGKAASSTNQTAEDEYGNKIVVPAGFKVLAHTGTNLSDVTYGYTGDTNSPAVQDGIVVENESDGNQFVWIPIGEIKNKDNTNTTIQLGRYSNYTVASDGTLPTPAQIASKTDYDTPVAIGTYYLEISSDFAGATVGDVTYGAASEYGNTKAYDLEEWISTTLDNGGYYIARFEASQNGEKAASKSAQTVWESGTQLNAAIAARKTYTYSTDAQYYSDLMNSYAWDTAIIFIEAYVDSTYAKKNNSTSYGKTGTNNDKVCNIHDMSGNTWEWTTETSTYSSESNVNPCVLRYGYFSNTYGTANYYTSYRLSNTVANYLYSGGAFRLILCIK